MHQYTPLRRDDDFRDLTSQHSSALDSLDNEHNRKVSDLERSFQGKTEMLQRSLEDISRKAEQRAGEVEAKARRDQEEMNTRHLAEKKRLEEKVLQNKQDADELQLQDKKRFEQEQEAMERGHKDAKQSIERQHKDSVRQMCNQYVHKAGVLVNNGLPQELKNDTMLTQSVVSALVDGLEASPEKASVRDAGFAVLSQFEKTPELLTDIALEHMAELCMSDVEELKRRTLVLFLSMAIASQKEQPRIYNSLYSKASVSDVLKALPAKLGEGAWDVDFLENLLSHSLPFTSVEEIDTVLDEVIYPTLSVSHRADLSKAYERLVKQVYGWVAAFKDSVLPWLDVLCDVVQLFSFVQQRRLQYLGLVFLGMCINGMATAYMITTFRPEWWRPPLNLISFGTGGLAFESWLSWKQGMRTQALLWYKIWETVESTFSFSTSGYDLMIAGHIESEEYPPLPTSTLVLRYTSLVLSLVCIPLTGYDTGMRTIYLYSEYEQFRESTRTNTGKFCFFLFHFFEICGHFVVLFPFALVSRPFGVFYLLGCSAGLNLLTTVLVAEMSCMKDPVFLFLINVMNITYGNSENFQRQSLVLALLRPFSWITAWIFIGKRVHLDRECCSVHGASFEWYEVGYTGKVLDIDTIMLTVVAAVGLVGYMVMLVQQIRAGRWPSVDEKFYSSVVACWSIIGFMIFPLVALSKPPSFTCQCQGFNA